MAKLAFGVSLYRWGILASLLIGLLAGIGAAAIGAGGVLSPAGTIVLAGAFGLLGQGLFLWAAFLITTQEPRVSLQEKTVTTRRVVRTCAVLNFTGQALQVAAPAALHWEAQVWVTVFGVVLSLAGIVGFFAQFVYFRQFASRLPDAKLAESTRTVMWGFIISYGILVVGGLALAVSHLGSRGASAGTSNAAATLGLMGGGVVSCAALVGVLVFVCWAYRLLLRYNRAFKQAAVEAGGIGPT
jgi:hypothetical protein